VSLKQKKVLFYVFLHDLKLDISRKWFYRPADVWVSSEQLFHDLINSNQDDNISIKELKKMLNSHLDGHLDVENFVVVLP